MSTETQSRFAGKSGPLRTILEFAAVVLVVAAAKTAIAEPFYVPSGSMEPTLQIGDELLATKFAYGYGTASLPSFIDLPESGRIFADLPERGDVVVFRWPGDRSQTWVKRVIGLPGDRIALRHGQVWINGTPTRLTREGIGQVENEDGSRMRATRFIETLPGGYKHPILKLAAAGPLDDMPEVTVPAGHLFVMGDNRDDSADSRAPAVSACCRSPTWSVASTPWSAPGTSRFATNRSGPGRPACGFRGFSRRFIEAPSESREPPLAMRRNVGGSSG